MDRLGPLVWKAFKNVYGQFIALLGTVVTIVAWGIDAKQSINISAPLLILILTFVALVFFVSVNLYFMLMEKILNLNEEVKSVKVALPEALDSYFNSISGEIVVVFSPSILISLDSVVALYGKRGRIEKRFAYGYVSHVQIDGLIQVTIFETEEDGKDVVQSLKNKTPGIFGSISLKNHFPFQR